MPQPLATGRFNHATLNCREVERSVEFYTSVMGMRRVNRPSFDFPGAWLYREGVGMMLHLNEDPAFSAPKDKIRTRRSHLAFRVPDIDAARSLLEEHGLRYATRTLPDHGYRQLFFHDPDGNLIEVGEWPDVEGMVQAAGG